MIICVHYTCLWKCKIHSEKLRELHIHDKRGLGDRDRVKIREFLRATLALLSSWSHFRPLHYFIECFMKQSVSVSRNSQVIKWAKFYQTNVLCHGKCFNLVRCTHDTGNIALEKLEYAFRATSFCNSLSHTHLYINTHMDTNSRISWHIQFTWIFRTWWTLFRWTILLAYFGERAVSWNKHDGTRNLFAFHIYIKITCSLAL